MTSDIEVVIRAHDPGQMAPLRRAVASVLTQSFSGTVGILLETSNFGRRLQPGDLWDGPLPAARSLRHTDIAFAFDSRFALLRNGLRRARARYLHILDYDDVLQPDGLAQLWHAADSATRATGQAPHLVIANADLVSTGPEGERRAPYRQGPVTVPSLLRHNEVPFNAILVDRSAAQTAIEACPALPLYEDYAFLLQLLAQRPPLILPPEIRVADYHAGPDQSRKYAKVQAFAQQVLDRMRDTVVLPVPGIQLRTDPAGSELRERADATLLEALPEAALSDTPLRGHIDRVQPWNGQLRAEGWCLDQDAPGTPLWGIYAIVQPGRAVLLETRIDRADVNAALGLAAVSPGFAGALPAPPEGGIWVVWRGQRVRLG